MLKYTDITQNTYIQSWTVTEIQVREENPIFVQSQNTTKHLKVTEIMAREVWNFDSCYTLIDYQIHIKTGRNMWFL